MLAIEFFTRLDEEPCPLKRAQQARGEGSHFSPPCRVPVLLFAIECREQGALGRAVFSLDIDDVRPDVPCAKGTIIKARGTRSWRDAATKLSNTPETKKTRRTRHM